MSIRIVQCVTYENYYSLSPIHPLLDLYPFLAPAPPHPLKKIIISFILIPQWNMRCRLKVFLVLILATILFSGA